MIKRLDDLRHRIPFWWWIAYDLSVFLVIMLGVHPRDEWFVLGLIVLFIAVVIDVVEFIVKMPSNRVSVSVPTDVYRELLGKAEALDNFRKGQH